MGGGTLAWRGVVRRQLRLRLLLLPMVVVVLTLVHALVLVMLPVVMPHHPSPRAAAVPTPECRRPH